MVPKLSAACRGMRIGTAARSRRWHRCELSKRFHHAPQMRAHPLTGKSLPIQLLTLTLLSRSRLVGCWHECAVSLLFRGLACLLSEIWWPCEAWWPIKLTRRISMWAPNSLVRVCRQTRFEDPTSNRPGTASTVSSRLLYSRERLAAPLAGHRMARAWPPTASSPHSLVRSIYTNITCLPVSALPLLQAVHPSAGFQKHVDHVHFTAVQCVYWRDQGWHV